MAPLETLGFALAGYGCTTCIGNSGPLDEPIAAGDRGERPGRRGGPVRQPQLRGPDPSARARQLPRLAAARRRVRPRRPGRHRPADRAARGPAPTAGRSSSPTSGRRRTRSARSSATSIDPELFRRTYAAVFDGDERWRALPIPSGDRYDWDPTLDVHRAAAVLRGPRPTSRRRSPTSTGARVLAVLGDSVTTDHISPAGSISPSSPGRPVAPGARRDAARVQLVRRAARPPRGDDARHVRATSGCATGSSRARRARTPSTCPTARSSSSTTPRCATRDEGVPLLVIAGREYGSGSSRDWAAKGTALLGVRAVIAESYERIHRSNLVGMGVLPLQFLPGESAASLGLTGRETLRDRRARGRADAAAAGRGRARPPTTATRAAVRGHRPPRRPDRRRLLPSRAASCRPSCAASRLRDSTEA